MHMRRERLHQRPPADGGCASSASTLGSHGCHGRVHEAWVEEARVWVGVGKKQQSSWARGKKHRWSWYVWGEGVS